MEEGTSSFYWKDLGKKRVVLQWVKQCLLGTQHCYDGLERVVEIICTYSCQDT